MVILRPEQAQRLQAIFARIATYVRVHVGVTDQQFAEWLLSLSARWLAAHGVSRENIQLWVQRELTQGPQLRPLVADAAARNDFGGRR